MEQVIREVSGDEAKYLALQFLGQNLGEMKELDKNIVSSLKPITSSINPDSIVQSIPRVQQQPQPIPAAPVTAAPVTVSVPLEQAAPVSAPGPVVIPSLASLQTPAAQPVTQQAAPTYNNPNQLELNFNESPYSVRIFERLEAIDKKLNTLIETQQEIIASFTDIKKKSETVTTND